MSTLLNSGLNLAIPESNYHSVHLLTELMLLSLNVIMQTLAAQYLLLQGAEHKRVVSDFRRLVTEDTRTNAGVGGIVSENG